LLPPLLLLPLLPPQAAMPALPLLPLIKQWKQWWQLSVAACSGLRWQQQLTQQNAIVDTCFVCFFLVNVRYTRHFPLEFWPEFRIPSDSGLN